MNFGELVFRLNQIQAEAAVWEEVVLFLRRAESGEFSIPVDFGDGRVSAEDIGAVRATVERKWKSLQDKLEAVEDVEVPGVELAQDSDLG